MMKKLPTTTIWDLPDDLLMDILARLSVKTLVQCRCICKPLQRLVTHPSFIKLHLNQAHLRHPRIFIRSLERLVTIDSESLDECVDPTPYLPRDHRLDVSELPYVVDNTVLVSCNGLICLSDRFSFLSLWNPSTTEYVQLPYDPMLDRYGKQRFNTIYSELAFGYDPIIEDYKVVDCVYDESFKTTETSVYTLGTNSWRRVEDVPSIPISYQSIHVDGVIYWLGEGHNMQMAITSFDLTKENFQEVICPDLGNRDMSSLCIWEGCLAIISDPFVDDLNHVEHVKHTDIWVMKDSWTRVLSIRSSSIPDKIFIEKPLIRRNNGQILLQAHEGLLLYDHVNTTARVHDHCIIPIGITTAFTYVTALTSITSLMGRKKVEDQLKAKPN